MTAAPDGLAFFGLPYQPANYYLEVNHEIIAEINIDFFLEFNMLSKLRNFLDLLVEISQLPVVHLHFDPDVNPDDVRLTYKYFTKPHAKYKIFKNKSLGAALIDLGRFGTREEYLQNIKARYEAKRAKSRGYIFCEIDRNNYIDEIHEINTSLDVRQGQPMKASYLKKNNYYEPVKNYKYYGVLSCDGRLMAYCTLGIYGDFVAFYQLMGHRNNDGTMHLLTTEAICRFIGDSTIKYIMYDTYFGATSGLKRFKTMIGFEPYRVKYHVK